ncbi:MAG: glycosyltransferase WbuB [Herbinix sp.]|nr:glycosyltransferase WbuB [Herbinix sp.]
MNILFITLYDIRDIDNNGIYEDLLREFSKNKHNVYMVSPSERRNGEKTHIIDKQNCCILKVRTGNIQKTSIIEKGIATVLLEAQFVNSIKKHYSKVKFDLVLYSTPPITIAKAVEFVKKRDGAKTYLLLKDIFPQNAVDIGMMSKTGIKAPIYRYFRHKEKKLYALSDYIGCMSLANMDYILKHNPDIDKKRVEVCPNCIEPSDMSVNEEVRVAMRQKYGIPIDKKVFVYGGNLGKPQGIDFLIKCLRSQKDTTDVYFLIVGSGTEYGKLEAYINKEKPVNVKLMSKLPKVDYDRMVGSCDVGLIFLDHRFSIPNFPSRLLSYIQAKLPVLAVTDPNTDIGKVIVNGEFGWWCESNDVQAFVRTVNDILKLYEKAWGDNGYVFLLVNYTATIAYNTIINAIEHS